MATTIGDLLVKLALDLSEFSKGLESSISSLQSEVKAFNKVGSQMSSAIVDPLQNIGKAAKESVGILVDQFGRAATAAAKVEKPVESITKSMNQLRTEAREAWEATETFGTRSETAAKKASSAWDTAAKKFSSVGGAMESLGQKMSLGITAPLAAIAAYSLNAFMEFEKAMNKVSALGEVTGKELQKLSDQAMALGASTQYSAKQVADGMGELAAAGFKAQEIFRAIPGVLSLAATEGMKLGDAARITSGILRGFGLDASAAGDVANVLAKTSAASAVSVTDLGYSFQYVAPLAKQMKISLLDVSAALGVLGNQGIRGEAAGTALRSMFQDLIKPANKEALSVLSQLGITTAKVTSGQWDLADILGKIQPILKDAALAFRVFGVRASDVMALAGDGTKAFKAMNEEIRRFAEGNGAAFHMAKTMNAGLSGVWEQFTSQVEQVATRIGQLLAPVAQAILKEGMKVLNVIEDWALAFSKLPVPIQQAALAVTALIAAIGPLLLVFGTLSSAIGSSMVALKEIGAFAAGSFKYLAAEASGAGAAISGFVAAAAEITGLGIGATIGAITVLIVAFVTELKLAYDHITRNWPAIAGVFEALWSDITGILGSIAKAIVTALGPTATGLVKSVWSGLSSFLANLWKNMGIAFDLMIYGWVKNAQQVAYIIPGMEKTAASLWNYMKSIESTIGRTTASSTAGFEQLGKSADGAFKNLKSAQEAVRQLMEGSEKFTGELNRQVIKGPKFLEENKASNVKALQQGLVEIIRLNKELEFSEAKSRISTQDRINLQEKLRGQYQALQSQLVSIAPEFGRSGDAATNSLLKIDRAARGTKSSLTMANSAVLSLDDTIRKGADSFEDFKKRYENSTKGAVAQTESWRNSIAHVEQQYKLAGKAIPAAVKEAIGRTSEAIAQNIKWTRLLDLENLRKEMEAAGAKASEALFKGWKTEADKQLKTGAIDIDSLLEPIVGTKEDAALRARIKDGLGFDVGRRTTRRIGGGGDDAKEDWEKNLEAAHEGYRALEKFSKNYTIRESEWAKARQAIYEAEIAGRIQGIQRLTQEFQIIGSSSDSILRRLTLGGDLNSIYAEIDAAFLRVQEAGVLSSGELVRVWEDGERQKLKISQEMMATMAGSWNTAGEFWSNLTRTMGVSFRVNVIDTIAGFTQKLNEDIRGTIDSLFDGDWRGAKDKLQAIGEDFQNIWKMALDPIKSMVQEFFTGINEQVTATVKNAILGKLVPSLKTGEEQTNLLGKTLQGMFTKTAKVGADSTKVLGDSISNAGKQFESAAASINKAAGNISTNASKGVDSLTKFASTLTMVTGVISAVMDVLQYLQMRRMEKDIGRIEVTTRGMLNEALNFRKVFEDATARIENNKWPELINVLQDSHDRKMEVLQAILTELQKGLSVAGGGTSASGSGAGSGETTPPVTNNNSPAPATPPAAPTHAEGESDPATGGTWSNSTNPDGSTTSTLYTDPSGSPRPTVVSDTAKADLEATYLGKSMAEISKTLGRVRQQYVLFTNNPEWKQFADYDSGLKFIVDGTGNIIRVWKDANSEVSNTIANTATAVSHATYTLGGTLEWTGNAITANLNSLGETVSSAVKQTAQQLQEALYGPSGIVTMAGQGTKALGLFGDVAYDPASGLEDPSTIPGPFNGMGAAPGSPEDLAAKKASQNLADTYNNWWNNFLQSNPVNGGALPSGAPSGGGLTMPDVNSGARMNVSITANNADAKAIGNTLVETWRQRGVDI